MKKRFALFLAVLMTLSLVSCGGEKAKRKNTDGDYEDEILELEDDAYDLFNESIVNLMEEEAYDISVKADVMQNDSTTTIEMDYQIADDGTDCTYYSHESMGGVMVTDTYYASGMKITSSGIALLGDPTVTAEEMDYDTFIAETGSPATMLAAVSVPRDAFNGAEIVEKDGITTVGILISGINGMPEQMAGIANTLFDLEHATDISYDTATFTLTMTEDAELVSIGLKAGMDFNDANGEPVAIDLDLLAAVNAVGDAVRVKTFEGEIPEPGQEPEEQPIAPGFNIDGYRDLIPEEYRGLIDQYLG